ncbi:MAG: hypothetical protein EOP83_19195 [Verrucomicrobiaceae bacterium]|nr:MAG: hypothetical protein EOP83_19195 [Verrucomicrobiaceae bacterium]
MSPDPLYRSLIFWAGVILITFLCWAWWDSFRRDTWRNESHLAFSNVAGAVSVGCYQVNFGKSSGRRAISPHAVPRPAFAALSLIDSNSKAALPSSDYNSGETLRLYLSRSPSGAYAFLNVPHWILLLVCLVPWLALLAWRWRRTKRLTGTTIDSACWNEES